MSREEVKAMLDKLPPERRKLAVERIVQKLNARTALMEKHKNLFEEVKSPLASEKRLGDESGPSPTD